MPGAIELAEQKNVFLGGDDFKSGQTKVKSVLTDFLVSAGIKVWWCECVWLDSTHNVVVVFLACFYRQLQSSW